MRYERIDALLTPESAAELLNTNPQTLANWRNTGRYSLPYVKIGRLVRYRQSDIIAFINTRTIAPVSLQDRPAV